MTHISGSMPATIKIRGGLKTTTQSEMRKWISPLVRRAPLLPALAIVLFACAPATDQIEVPNAVNEIVVGASEDPSQHEEAVLKDSPHHVMVIADRCGIPDPAIDAASNNLGAGAHPLVNEIHTGLTRIAYGDDLEPTAELELAESFRFNGDATEITFTLRDHLLFSDGSPLTAEDVAWSWSRAVALSQEWSAAWRVFGNVVGASDVANGTTSYLLGINVVDTNTLSISFNEPIPRFPELIAHPVASVLKKGNVNNWPVAWDNEAIPPSPPTAKHPITPDALPAQFTEATMPIGAGPFQLAGYRHSSFPSTCQLIANPHYFRGAPTLDAVVYEDLDVYRPRDESDDDDSDFSGQRVSAFLEGNLDVMVGGENLLTEHLDQSGLQGHHKLENVSPPPLILYITLNADQPPFDDAELRKAIYAVLIDSELNEAVSEFRSNPIAGLQSSNRGFVNEFAVFDDAEIDQDVRERLVEALADYDVNLHSSYSGFIPLLEDALASFSEVVGVEVGIEFINTEDDFQQLLDDGQILMRPLQPSPIHPVNEAVIDSFAVAFGTAKDGGEFEDLKNRLNIAATELDPVERSAMYADIERRALERALVVPLLVGYPERQIILQPWVHGFNLKRFGGSVFHDVWFDDTAPQRPLP